MHDTFPMPSFEVFVADQYVRMEIKMYYNHNEALGSYLRRGQLIKNISIPNSDARGGGALFQCQYKGMLWVLHAISLHAL